MLARNDVRLFLTSFAILFVELMLIRWIPANVKYIGFFSNFLLIASFLGIGLGILLGRRGLSPRLSPFAFLLAGVVALVVNLQLNVQVQSVDEIFFGLAESSTAADLNFLVLPITVGLVVALLATLALPLGPLLKSMPPLRAYAFDIVGSMSGIAAFAMLSALGTEPVVWFAVALALFVAVELGLLLQGQLLVVPGQSAGERLDPHGRQQPLVGIGARGAGIADAVTVLEVGNTLPGASAYTDALIRVRQRGEAPGIRRVAVRDVRQEPHVRPRARHLRHEELDLVGRVAPRGVDRAQRLGAGGRSGRQGAHLPPQQASGGKDERAAAHRVVERPDSHAVPAQHEPTARAVPQRIREITVERMHTLHTRFEIGLDDGLRV